jgi:hypothetical protein
MPDNPTELTPAESQEIPRDHTWKPPEFERRLPELLEKARSGPQLFKVWKGDIPRCEIETKGSVAHASVSIWEWDKCPRLVWLFRLDHRIGTDLWPVLEAIVKVLGPPILLTPYGTPPRRLLGSGDPVRPFLELTGCWPAHDEAAEKPGDGGRSLSAPGPE